MQVRQDKIEFDLDKVKGKLGAIKNEMAHIKAMGQ